MCVWCGDDSVPSLTAQLSLPCPAGWQWPARAAQPAPWILVHTFHTHTHLSTRDHWRPGCRYCNIRILQVIFTLYSGVSSKGCTVVRIEGYGLDCNICSPHPHQCRCLPPQQAGGCTVRTNTNGCRHHTLTQPPGEFANTMSYGM